MPCLYRSQLPVAGSSMLNHCRWPSLRRRCMLGNPCVSLLFTGAIRWCLKVKNTSRKRSCTASLPSIASSAVSLPKIAPSSLLSKNRVSVSSVNGLVNSSTGPFFRPCLCRRSSLETYFFIAASCLQYALSNDERNCIYYIYWLKYTDMYCFR